MAEAAWAVGAVAAAHAGRWLQGNLGALLTGRSFLGVSLMLGCDVVLLGVMAAVLLRAARGGAGAPVLLFWPRAARGGGGGGGETGAAVPYSADLFRLHARWAAAAAAALWVLLQLSPLSDNTAWLAAQANQQHAAAKKLAATFML